ncbi:conserved hypothetical protein [Pseudolactococcus piscium]|nr:conserved hypothetical protein [Lactococcus piscium]
MVNREIRSSTVIASGAIQEIMRTDSLDLAAMQVNLTCTKGISGMVTAVETSNLLLVAVGEFSSAILMQAKKIPELAKKIEARDIEDAKVWERET